MQNMPVKLQNSCLQQQLLHDLLLIHGRAVNRMTEMSKHLSLLNFHPDRTALLVLAKLMYITLDHETPKEANRPCNSQHNCTELNITVCHVMRRALHLLLHVMELLLNLLPQLSISLQQQEQQNQSLNHS